MPGKDKTGPEGQGPMTGRRAGYCAGQDVPEFSGRGMGYGRGAGGRGMRCRGMNPVYDRVYAPMPTYVPTPVEEQRHLEECAKQLEDDLESIKERIQELNKTEE